MSSDQNNNETGQVNSYVIKAENLSQSIPNEFHEEDYYAGFWRRGIAYQIDASIFILCLFLIYIILTHGNLILLSSLIETNLVLGISFLFITLFGYYTFFIYKYGATIGQRIVGIKVKRKDSSVLTYKHSVIRFIAKISCFLVPVLLDSLITDDYLSDDIESLLGLAFIGLISIDYLIQPFTKNKQTIHDMIAGTIVVDIKRFSYARIWMILGVLILIELPTIPMRHEIMNELMNDNYVNTSIHIQNSETPPAKIINIHHINLPKDLIRYLEETYKDSDGPIDAIEINKSEAYTLETSSDACGSWGCDTVIIKKINNKYQTIYEGYFYEIKHTNQLINGFDILEFSVHGSVCNRVEADTCHVKTYWNGKKWVVLSRR